MIQQTQRPKANPSKPPTPLELLLAEKKTLTEKCRLREKLLSEDFEYIRSNASALILSGLSEMLFSSIHPKKTADTQAVAIVDNRRTPAGNPALSNLLGFAGQLTPIVWKIIKPAIIKWGINKAKAFIIGLFTKKERANSVK